MQFVKDIETGYATFIHRMIPEMQNDLYLCYIDYAKAPDESRHKKMLEQSGNLDIVEKEIRIIQNI